MIVLRLITLLAMVLLPYLSVDMLQSSLGSRVANMGKDAYMDVVAQTYYLNNF
jgi:hypothetical protein